MSSVVPLPLSGKTVLLTGASRGIGLAAARQLARQGAHLVLVCRHPERGAQARAAAQQVAAPGAVVDLLCCDLAELAQVHRLCDEVLARYDRLDVLINNAGVLPGRFAVTPEGHELCWATNHLAPFVLTNRLLPLLEAAGAGRIITVTSEAHRLGEIESAATRRNDPAHGSAFTAYCDSKLANILFTKALAERLELTGVTAYCLHPGVVRSHLYDASPWSIRWLLQLARPFFRTAERAAQELVFLAHAPEVISRSGNYFKNNRPARTSERGANAAEIHRLWRISAAETGIAE